MRTTVDLPDDLYRQAKSEAALQGKPLRDLVEEGLRRVLGLPIRPPGVRRVEFPLHHSRHPASLSVAEVNRTQDEARLDEDASHVAAG